MTEKLRKRLEEAFVEWLNEHRSETTIRNYEDETLAHFCLKAGAGLGYKEAIEQAKEWLKNTEHFYQGGSEEYPDVESMYDTIEEMLADFEAYMNKFGEE